MNANKYIIHNTNFIFFKISVIKNNNISQYKLFVISLKYNL